MVAFSKRTNIKSQSAPTIIAIGGGKGGIGKSFVSSNLAVCLARLGRSVTVMDLDLGSANLHTCLGVQSPQLSLTDFLSGRVRSLSDLSTPTEINSLHLIGGFNDALNIANMTEAQKDMVLKDLSNIQSEFLILDLGAGTAENTLDFFLAADTQLLVITPEPTSIENSYRFLKSAYYRRLRIAETEHQLNDLIDQAMDQKNSLGIKTPADLMKHMLSQNPDKKSELIEVLKSFNVQVLMNQARTRSDIELGMSVKSVCRKYFGIQTEFAGYIDYDNAAWQSLRRKRPVVLEYPGTTVVAQLLKITKSLILPQTFRDVV